jgi:hypothetical protein
MATTARAITPDAATAQDILAKRADSPIARGRQGGLDIEVKLEHDALWIVLRREEQGGLALRVPVFSTECRCREIEVKDAIAAVECTSDLGTGRLVLTGEPFGLEQLHARFDYTPTEDLAIEWVPRDLLPFDAEGKAAATEGEVEAKQRKLNTGLLYFTLNRPAFGKVLYLQNLTALNPYFNATGTKPENAVGGEWPELGYRLPVNAESGRAVLPGGKRLTLYDTFLSVRGYPQSDEADSAWQFLDMLGGLYNSLKPPVPAFHDWNARAEATLADLSGSPDARIKHYDHTYFHPYTDAEYPDVMVQLSIASAIDDWERWSGEKNRLRSEIMAGLEKFYDPKLKTLRRYLPNVGNDKDPDAVDSRQLVSLSPAAQPFESGGGR